MENSLTIEHPNRNQVNISSILDNNKINNLGKVSSPEQFEMLRQSEPEMMDDNNHYEDYENISHNHTTTEFRNEVSNSELDCSVIDIAANTVNEGRVVPISRPDPSPHGSKKFIA